MALISINKQPSPRDLRGFGIGLAIFTLVVAGLSYYRHRDLLTVEWIVGIGWGLSLVYFAIPPLRRPIYFGWVYATYPIGWTISNLVLALLFYLVVTPIALILRLTGRDMLKLRFDRDAKSYWRPHDPGGSIERYFRQF
jgi:hypothetical protein